MNIYEEYAQIQKEEDAIAERKKAIRARLEAELPPEGVKNELGSFSFRISKSYTYSPRVAEKEKEIAGLQKSLEVETQKIREELMLDVEEAELKKIKDIEEIDGTAKAEIKKTLTVKIN